MRLVIVSKQQKLHVSRDLNKPSSRHCTLMIDGRKPRFKRCAFGAVQTPTKVRHVVVLDNVVLMAASQIITVLHAFRQPTNPSTATNNSTRRLPAVEDPIIPSAPGTPTISQEGVGVATNLPMEGENSIQRAHTATLPEYSSSELVSLRTVPIWIKGNGKKVKVNAVLDDASTCEYRNFS